jgi:hypothetical protein
VDVEPRHSQFNGPVDAEEHKLLADLPAVEVGAHIEELDVRRVLVFIVPFQTAVTDGLAVQHGDVDIEVRVGRMVGDDPFGRPDPVAERSAPAFAAAVPHVGDGGRKGVIVFDELHPVRERFVNLHRYFSPHKVHHNVSFQFMSRTLQLCYIAFFYDPH